MWDSAPLSVTGLTHMLRDALRADFGRVQVRGEISDLTLARSGHWYFELSDRGASLKCVMFSGDNHRVGRRPQVGDEVVLTGGVDVYARRGALQFIARRLVHAGDGDRQARIEALKRKLQAEGLTAPERKRPLPFLPRAIGVATSTSGAAIHDILEVLHQRFPGVTVFVSHCLVQGPRAPQQIARALHRLAEHGEADVIIVGRGGGSADDLSAFDEEVVARAVVAMPVPVVSAVGHEVDVSICDLVADVRAATPSHAAELVVPERESLLLALDDLDERQRRATRALIDRHRRVLAALRLRGPAQRLVDARRRLTERGRRLDQAVKHELVTRRSSLESHGGRLHALSPQAVLDRGYAVALRDGEAVLDAASLRAGEALTLRLARGQAEVTVRG